MKAIDPQVQQYVQDISRIARGHGLDFFETRFVLVDPDVMTEVAAYGGFPVRYPHWRFGMEYESLHKSHEWGFSRIYEMVINTDPAYAYLMNTNTSVEHKMVIAHVLAHVDFFKNNLWFKDTDRRMLDTMANHAAAITRYMEKYGIDEVENFIDQCMSLENLINPYDKYRPRPVVEPEEVPGDVPKFKAPRKYLESYINPKEAVEAQREQLKREQQRAQKLPPEPERDVLGFLAHHANLPDWKLHVIGMIRDEAYYFAPQGMTKIINEGWAAFWHSRLLTTAGILTDSEILDFADRHSMIVQTAPGRLNPYKLGLDLLRDIEERWNKGRFGREWEECTDMAVRANWDRQLGKGLEKLFEVRRVYNDLMFLDEFMTPDFMQKEKMFLFSRDSDGQARIDSRDFEKIKQALLDQLTNRGQPVIEVYDANYKNAGELLLTHRYEGRPLRKDWAEATLGNLQRIWGRPVALATFWDDKPVLWRHDGNKMHERKS